MPGFRARWLTVAFALALSGAAHAQERDCTPPGGDVRIGGEIALTWRMRAGFTCSVRIWIGNRHEVRSISVVQQPRIGRAGGTIGRRNERDEVGRTMIRIAYMSPVAAKAGEDAFVVRVVTRNKESGEINNTLLNYSLVLWRD